MSLASILGIPLKEIVEGADKLLGRFKESPAEKAEHLAEFQNLLIGVFGQLEHSVRTEVEQKVKLMIAEMQQDDNFTKRARPSVVYFGLFAIFVNHMLVPFILTVARIWDQTIVVDSMALPVEFWATWGGVCGIWVIGRSAEKRGIQNKVINMVTGNGKPKIDL